ncbi:hypothetical protein [Nocardioides sp.]|uniref:hypothetical protein n=1 Tax=Nocardioides sp. TaxID=35761 RepID=UPI00351517F7
MTMANFEEAVREWREASFPHGSALDVLDEVHADLVLYDTWVAESVLPYVDRGIWEPAVPDVLGALDELIRQVEKLRAEGTDDLDAACAYLAYAELLRAVYVAFVRERQRP